MFVFRKIWRTLFSCNTSKLIYTVNQLTDIKWKFFVNFETVKSISNRTYFNTTWTCSWLLCWKYLEMSLKYDQKSHHFLLERPHLKQLSYLKSLIHSRWYSFQKKPAWWRWSWSFFVYCRYDLWPYCYLNCWIWTYLCWQLSQCTAQVLIMGTAN